MENIISSVSIKNFKSIKDLSFDCKKVNVFIGKPNVGKSNILEALSFFALPLNSYGNLSMNVRLKTMKNLYYDNNTKDNIEVKITDKHQTHATAYISEDGNIYELFIGDSLYLYEFNRDLPQYLKEIGHTNELKNPIESYFSNSIYRLYFNQTGELDINRASRNLLYANPLKNYSFRNGVNYSGTFHEYLFPPDGQNLVTILQDNNQLFNEVQSFFEEYGFELLIDVDKNEFEIQKRVEKRVYKYPFELMADTLQRIIFYLAAIESNKESAIIFEEPETHSFPPYISTIARRISMDQTNQFFISTHSPYLLNTLIEDVEFKDINVFITYFEDYQTKLHALQHEELREILDDSIDAFFNLDRFVTDPE